MNALVQKIIDISKQAGEEILKIYAEKSLFGVETKKDDSPLTAADQKSNEVIVTGLQKLTIQYPIISEETKLQPYEERKDYDRFWLVDPLDGTKEFIKRNGEFTVNIALVEGGAPILGVVYVPVTGETYWATKGDGAYYQKGDGAAVSIRANQYSTDDKGLRVVCSRSHINEDTQAFIDALNQPEKVSKGSSLKFLMMASGLAEVYPRLGPTMEWDTAAAQIVLEEAGGSVIRYDNGQPLHYNKEDLLNPYFIAKANEANLN